MPQREFDLYLKLFANLLDLAPGQREAIRDELRDHLEERLAELSELDVPREEAIERALDEFGDAAGLAGSFTQLARERRRQRRLAMYRTTGTAIVVSLVILAAVAYWPDAQLNPGVKFAAAQGGLDDGEFDASGFGVGLGAGGDMGGEMGGFGPAPMPARRTDPGAKLRDEVETALDEPVTVAFDQMPLWEAVAQVASDAGIDVLFDDEFLKDTGIEDEQTVTLRLRRRIPARVALDLILDRVPNAEDVGFVAREGFVYVTSMSESLQLEVYDVRDLVGRETSRPRSKPSSLFGGGGLGGGAGEFGGEGGMMSGASSGMGHSGPRTTVDALLDVVISNVGRNGWEESGGPGSISGFDGLLVVRNTPRAHREVQQLLEKLRVANGQRAIAPRRGRSQRGPSPGGLGPGGSGLGSEDAYGGGEYGAEGFGGAGADDGAGYGSSDYDGGFGPASN